MASSRWRNVTREIKRTACESCGRETQFLFKGYAFKVFRLDPILSGRNLLFGTLVRLVEAMVCQRCQETNQPPEKPKVCQHCDCAPRYSCCYCNGGQE